MKKERIQELAGVQLNEGKIEQQNLKSNGHFSIIKDRYGKKQHPNQQGGMDEYVDVIDHSTGNINSVKLHENKKGVHFKKQGTWYIDKFNEEYLYIPFQMIKV